jgi:hypothetical protein
MLRGQSGCPDHGMRIRAILCALIALERDRPVVLW